MKANDFLFELNKKFGTMDVLSEFDRNYAEYLMETQSELPKEEL